MARKASGMKPRREPIVQSNPQNAGPVARENEASVCPTPFTVPRCRAGALCIDYSVAGQSATRRSETPPRGCSTIRRTRPYWPGLHLGTQFPLTPDYLVCPPPLATERESCLQWQLPRKASALQRARLPRAESRLRESSTRGIRSMLAEPLAPAKYTQYFPRKLAQSKLCWAVGL